MDFSLTGSQELLLSTARDVFQQHCPTSLVQELALNDRGFADDLWRRELAGDPAAIGSVLRINGAPFTVIGVAPPSFSSLAVGEEVSLWLTFSDHRNLVPAPLRHQ